MNRYIYLSLFVFVLMMSFISAQPPFQSTVIMDKALQIEAPIIESIKQNQSFEFHIHIHNSTDGRFLTNNSIHFCAIHVYSPEGDHLIETNMTFNSNGIDYEYEVEGGNFSSIGQYAILFYCQVDPTIEYRGGFFEYGFDVTPDGSVESVPRSIIRVLLILVFISMFVGYYYLTKNTNFEAWERKITERYKENNVVKMVFAMFGYHLVKQSFLIYYLLGLPIVFLLASFATAYNIESLIGLTKGLLTVYIVGVLLVGIIFMSKIQEWAMMMIDLTKEMDWGFDHGK